MPSSRVILISSCVIPPLVILAAVLSFRLAAPPPPAEKSVPSAKVTPPTTTLTDSADVFQKAFWKRPTADDKILHAERREWADDAGVQKWQWFIAVKPSPALVDHLITDNAFSLARSASRGPAAGRPEWFPESGDDHEVFASASGTFTLLRDRNSGLLYATDSGGGFRPGAPEPPKALPVARVPTGRLPPTPPPTPPNP